MAIKASNKLLPLLAGLVLAVVVGLIFLFTQTDVGKEFNFFSLDAKRVKEVNVDADSTVNTLETIAVDAASLKSKYKDVNETIAHQNEKLQNFSETLKQLNETNTALRQQIQEQNQKMAAIEDAGAPGTVDLNKIKEEVLESIKDGKLIPESIRKAVTEGDYAIGSLPSGLDNNREGSNLTISNSPIDGTIKRVEPETSTRVHGVNVPLQQNGDVSPAFIKSLHDNPEKQSEGSDKNAKDNEPVIDPRYTIFANTILNDSVAVTTLIGRIPIQGNVGDAAPFKVLIGSENLAANGFSIPGLDGMIMSGTVFGDANLECVRGKILSATYIFEDGRGITFPQKRRKNRPIGWISDEHGNPCIPGTYISNIRTQMKNRIILAMAAGAANAFASAETTTLTDSNGATSSSITGNSGKYILGSAVSDGTRQITDFLNAQKFDVWDAVVVPSGHKVAVHIDETLELNQTSLQRKVIYEQHSTPYGLTD